MIDGGLHAEFKKHLPDFFFQRVETGGTGRGIPDAHYISPGGAAGWLELKQTDGWLVPLMPEQQGWADRYARMGGRIWCAVRQRRAEGPRVERRDVLWLVPGAWAIPAAAGGLRGSVGTLLRPWGLGVGPWQWPGGPRKWDWHEVRRLLTQ